jgi:hypothetical protein
VVVKGVASAKGIVAGSGHVAVLLRDGTIRLWGHDGWGRIGVGTSGGYHELPMKPALANVTALYTGLNDTFAVRADGSLWRWGGARTYGPGDFCTDQRAPAPTALPQAARANPHLR